MAGEVGIKIKVSAKDAYRNLNKLKNSSNKLSEAFNKVTRRSQKTQTAFRNTGKAARSASTGVRSLAASLRPLLAAFAVIGSARFVFIKSAEVETQRKSLEVLTGSVGEANKIIRELQAFGSVTPFTSSELIEQSKRLKAFGFETNEITDTVKRLSNVAGATGADLSGIATAFGQIRAKGKLQQEENLQLLERGVDITTELKKITGLQGEAFEEAQRKGKIGADLVNQALINLTNEGGAFFNGATAQADTLAGRFSTLVDSVETLARTIGERLGPTIKTILNLAIDAVNAINRLITRATLGPQIVQAELQARQKAIDETKEKFNFNIGAVEGPLAGAGVEEFFKERLEINTTEAINELLNKNLEIENKIANKEREINNEINKRITGTNNLNTANTQLNEKLEKQRQTQEQITNILASGMTNAVMGLIEGTKTLGQALADIAKQLASMFLNKAFSSIFSGMFGGGGGGGIGGGALPPAPIYVAAQGGFSRSGGFKAFQSGGVVNSPTMGMIGEGGESEYVIPASKMDGAMARYSAGARGGAVIPGGSGNSGTVAGGSGNTVVEYTGPTLNFNGDEYVPKSAVPEIIGAAAKRGAMAGKAQVLGTLKNSRSQRASLGL